MGIEHDIHQKDFRNEYQKALINLLYTHNYVVGEMSAVFKKYGITRQQFNVLRILRGQSHNPITINVIKERMLDKMSDASRIVARLKKKGLIKRNQSKGDRRAAEVRITDKGLKLLSAMETATDDFDNFFTNFSKEDAHTLNTLLDNLRQKN